MTPHAIQLPMAGMNICAASDLDFKHLASSSHADPGDGVYCCRLNERRTKSLRLLSEQIDHGRLNLELENILHIDTLKRDRA